VSPFDEWEAYYIKIFTISAQMGAVQCERWLHRLRKMSYKDQINHYRVFAAKRSRDLVVPNFVTTRTVPGHPRTGEFSRF
jgi:hypothetical protein